MSETIKTQLTVLGAGPGGYAAAFLAADLGLDVVLVDRRDNPGGVCLFEGCIPSKALLHVAEVIDEARHAESWGVSFGKPTIELDKVRAFKEKVVTNLTGGLGVLSKNRKVDFIQGEGELLGSKSMKVTKNDGSEVIVEHDNLILATGSRPIVLPHLPRSFRVMDSTDALALKDIPESLLVIGGGYIGLELGTVYHALGSEVSVVEMMKNIMLGADEDLARPLRKRLKGQLHEIMVKTKVTACEEIEGGLKVTFEKEGGETFEKAYSHILSSVGRRPNIEIPGLDKTQVQLDGNFIKVDEQMRTTDPSIFAIGDIVGQPMLAHKASHEGRVAAEVISGHKVAFEPLGIPAVVFTDPEIAWVGLTEKEAKEQGREVTVAKFPWAASGRAIAIDRTEGLTKLILDPESERVLGVGIVGKGAGEMIAEGTLAIEMGAVAADLKLTIHAHPTLSETVMESAEAFYGQATHIYRPKRK